MIAAMCTKTKNKKQNKLILLHSDAKQSYIQSFTSELNPRLFRLGFEIRLSLAGLGRLQPSVFRTHGCEHIAGHSKAGAPKFVFPPTN